MRRHAKHMEALDAPPPNNETVERALLGAILLNPANLRKAARTLACEDFYSINHRSVWETLLLMSAKGLPIDSVTLAVELGKRKLYGRVGGGSYIASLLSGCPSQANASYYLSELKELGKKRALRLLATELLAQSLDRSVSSAEMVSKITHAMESLKLCAVPSSTRV